MQVRDHKTKIVGTIGPASESPEMLERLIRTGLDVARLNFSHGDFSGHRERIANLRAASDRAGRAVAVLADLPGPKMRLGTIQNEPIHLRAGDPFTLTTDSIVGDNRRCSMSFAALPQVVKPGDRLYLNDGLVHLLVERIEGTDVHCVVAVGGELRSRKGLNLPGINLGISAFTEHDRDCLKFALENGVDAVSQSFVQNAHDIELVRTAAESLGHHPFIFAKIERAEAVQNYDEILRASDGIMVARGDLGIEVPMEEIAVIQKQLISGANAAGKPVITATQMLESMITNRLPTRAECTDVANAIFDGTDCVMLSGECAVGQFPEEAVAMLGKIAAATEPHRHRAHPSNVHGAGWTPSTAAQAMGILVERALETAPSAAVFVPTLSGDTARMISRFKPSVWIVALSANENVCRNLKFSYGVEPVFVGEEADDWRPIIYDWLHQQHIRGKIALLVAAASTKHPDASHRIEFLRIPESVASATSSRTTS
ncbi:pyruvate kinase [Candidatus Koribacter versatilis Ellin345]|uniref:Pyruvate kinase n=1 Tax=Koribacter versatilis (strain Ellin345) TaxID=204669 RepID=Q1IJ65_KORVE|nr:pyruvate kinase [Candidatus Koribacter versatilis]ABF43085.1 pyruvate kinase [Candidatus Koribacter versatilis Ellin345]